MARDAAEPELSCAWRPRMRSMLCFTVESGDLWVRYGYSIIGFSTLFTVKKVLPGNRNKIIDMVYLNPALSVSRCSINNQENTQKYLEVIPGQ